MLSRDGLLDSLCDFELHQLISMASAEEKILLSRLLDLFRADPDKITFLQAGTSRINIANNQGSQ